MENIATTRMSSKGQVVIPEEIRMKLGLKAGSKFVVLGSKDYVVLKTLEHPSKDEFSDLLKQARRQAGKAGLKKLDIDEAVRKVRARKK